jgi:hypothetical protein
VISPTGGRSRVCDDGNLEKRRGRFGRADECGEWWGQLAAWLPTVSWSVDDNGGTLGRAFADIQAQIELLRRERTNPGLVRENWPEWKTRGEGRE